MTSAAAVRMTGVCPGPCNKHWRDARRAYLTALADYEQNHLGDPDVSRPEPPQITARRGDPIWCGRHKTWIRQCLAQLDILAGLLGWAADGYAASSDAAERVSGSSVPPSPSEAADQLDALMVTLTGWETLYRARVLRDAGTGARHGDLAAAHTEVIAWLGTHLDGPRGILSITAPVDPGAEDPVPIGEAFGLEITAWHRSWKHRTKAGVRKLRKPLRCPSCHLLLMTWIEGDDTVECQAPDCGRIMTYADYEATVEQRAGAGHGT